MPYQNVGTPRFFVCGLQWMKSLGLLTSPPVEDETYRNTRDPLEVIGINPTSPFEIISYHQPGNPVNLYYNFVNFPLFSSKSWIGLLGHNLYSTGLAMNVWNYGGQTVTSMNNVFARNAERDGNFMMSAPNDGFSIWGFSLDAADQQLYFAFSGGYVSLMCNTICAGQYFDMPHSPDLKLTMTRESGNTKSYRSKRGSTFTNSFYIKPPMWGPVAPWELYEEPYMTTQPLSRSGRRVWDLSFNYLSDSSIFPDTASLSRAEEGGGYSFNYNDGFDNTLLHDYNFYSQVIHKTNGGELPFIFQPDKNDTTQFAKCRFDMSAFKFTQVANGVYNIKLKIRETW